MPIFDSTKPINATNLKAFELRDQFNALKEIIDALTTRVEQVENNQSTMQTVVSDLQADVAGRTTQNQVETLISENSAAKVDSVDGVGLSIDDPPSQNQVQQIADKVDELINGLHR